MIFIGMFLLVGGLFSALLFNIHAGWGDKTAAMIRNVFTVFTVVGLLLMIIGAWVAHKMPVYEYEVKAHYVDGHTKTMCFKGKYDPKITGNRGVYFLKYGGYYEIGVVRFDIISKHEKLE